MTIRQVTSVLIMVINARRGALAVLYEYSVAIVVGLAVLRLLFSSARLLLTFLKSWAACLKKEKSGAQKLRNDKMFYEISFSCGHFCVAQRDDVLTTLAFEQLPKKREPISCPCIAVNAAANRLLKIPL